MGTELHAKPFPPNTFRTSANAPAVLLMDHSFNGEAKTLESPQGSKLQVWHPQSPRLLAVHAATQMETTRCQGAGSAARQQQLPALPPALLKVDG